jgi:sterol O-acyltransferase
VAVFATFLISAVAHEIIFSVAFKTARPWFFLGMLAQLPLMACSQLLRGSRRGNFLVWWSLFSGQPLLELLYVREYLSLHPSFFCAK